MTEPSEVQALAEQVSDALAATTEGTNYDEAPEPSDEPGSPYVMRLTHELHARGVRVAPSPNAPDPLLREYRRGFDAGIEFQRAAPSPDAPGLREAAQNVVDRAHINMERKDAGLDPLPTRVSELERVLAASGDAPREGLDVERLTEALIYTGDGEGVGYDGTNRHQYAVNLARAYARLASESHPTKEPTSG